ncbi:hypothetical protein V8G54_005221 [Vigna mungo]|uniref:Plant PDR ABC transporter associated domain-containing protein n=1 Tax=Vigna mungo TaxID=3915 RepID=A0AAQ3PJR6_VIGMU
MWFPNAHIHSKTLRGVSSGQGKRVTTGGDSNCPWARALLGFVSLLNITFTLALTFLNPTLEKPHAIILKGSHGNKHKDKALQDIGLPLKLPGNGPNRNTKTMRLKEVVESSHRRKRGMILPFEPHSLTFDGITYSKHSCVVEMVLLGMSCGLNLIWIAVSQFGDLTTTVEVNETVKEFLRRYFGYKDDFVGVAAGVVANFGQ